MALAQIGLSLRLAYADDFQITLAIAWFGALFLAREGRSGSSSETAAGLPSLVPATLGALVVVASLAAMIVAPTYCFYFRLVPLCTGAGLAAASAGRHAWTRYRAPLLMLALPLLNSPPRALHAAVDPVLIPLTTWCAGTLDHAAGHAIVPDGHILRMPNDTLDIVDGCSGAWAITRLLVLVALVVALFPTTWRQRAALAASAVVVGFCVNTVRIAVLATTVLYGNDDGFFYWHQGRGATYFAVAATIAAGLWWWLLLRRTGGPAPQAP
jgi:exosortase